MAFLFDTTETAISPHILLVLGVALSSNIWTDDPLSAVEGLTSAVGDNSHSLPLPFSDDDGTAEASSLRNAFRLLAFSSVRHLTHKRLSRGRNPL